MDDKQLSKQLQYSRIHTNNINEIDRKIAIFYHPLFQEVSELWLSTIFGGH
jgi:hypothetical protein